MFFLVILDISYGLTVLYTACLASFSGLWVMEWEFVLGSCGVDGMCDPRLGWVGNYEFR